MLKIKFSCPALTVAQYFEMRESTPDRPIPVLFPLVASKTVKIILCVLQGLRNESDSEGVHLGNFTYIHSSDPLQLFQVHVCYTILCLLLCV